MSYVDPTAPYAMFRFNGEVVVMNKDQFMQALADSRLCKCNSCLCCRVREYRSENLIVGATA